MVNFNILDFIKLHKSVVITIDKDIVNRESEMAYIAYTIAKELGYKKENIEKVVLASILHDICAYRVEEIGKTKCFKLNNTKKHCTYGYCMLNQNEYLKSIAPYMLYHHHLYSNKDNYIKNIKIPDEAFLIGLSEEISKCFINLNYNEKNIVKFIHNINEEKFDKKHLQKLKNIIKKENVIKNILDKKHIDIIHSVLNGIKIDNELLSKYLVYLPLSIDFFSIETSIHIVRVSTIVREICTIMNVDLDYAKKIELASYFHDIGKVCIPKSILEKNESLNKDEFETIKKHVFYTKVILQRANIDNQLINLACNHHERLDGSGYMMGLKKEELTKGDQIVSISDIFCALTEKRHYKEVFDKTKVVSILDDMVQKNYIDKDIVGIIKYNYEKLIVALENEEKKYKNVLNEMTKEYTYISSKFIELGIK